MSNPVLSSVYKSINVIHSSNLSTFVPKPFFNEKKLSAYLNYNVKVLENDYIAYDVIENTEMVNVYIPSIHLNNFLFDQYGSFDYKHSSTILVENLLKKYTNSDSIHYIVHVENNSFQIIVLKRKKLEFYNSFNFSTKEDFIYYILFTAEQLELNPENFELVLAGNIDIDSDFYKIAYAYVRKVSLLENRSQLKFSSNIKEETRRRYFTLLNQYT